MYNVPPTEQQQNHFAAIDSSPIKNMVSNNMESQVFDDQQEYYDNDLSDADISEDDDYRHGINVQNESPMMDAHNETILRNS